MVTSLERLKAVGYMGAFDKKVRDFYDNVIFRIATRNLRDEDTHMTNALEEKEAGRMG